VWWGDEQKRGGCQGVLCKYSNWGTRKKTAGRGGAAETLVHHQKARAFLKSGGIPKTVCFRERRGVKGQGGDKQAEWDVKDQSRAQDLGTLEAAEHIHVKDSRYLKKEKKAKL